MLQCNSRVTVTVSVNLGNLAGNQCIITIHNYNLLPTVSCDMIGITCTIKLAFNSGT